MTALAPISEPVRDLPGLIDRAAIMLVDTLSVTLTPTEELQ